MKYSVLAVTPILLSAVLPSQAEGGVCDPTRSTWHVAESPVGCQFRFNRAGTLDALTIAVTLRDAFDTAVPCSTWIEIVDASPAACEVDPSELRTNVLTGSGWTTSQGEALFVLNRFGGRGEFTLELRVTDCCHGSWSTWASIFTQTVGFTTPDQNGSCDSAVDIIDLALWASCLAPAPYCRTSDFGCDGGVDVRDLAVWASGL